MDLVYYIIAGAAVGFAIGLTGIGGGSLMTPILLMFGFPPHIAIGTDLLYASITKAGGVVMHQKQKTINWSIMMKLAAGSIPASLLTVIVLNVFFQDVNEYSGILTNSLGLMLILTAVVLIFKRRIQEHQLEQTFPLLQNFQHHAGLVTFLMGIALGVLVTLSSVGAGAFGTAVLLVLYPSLLSIKIIGTDLAHAVPLTLVAGLGHLFLGHVDFVLLGSLLIGSLPAIYLGTRLGRKLPENVLQPILASALLLLGFKFAFA